MLMDTEFKRAIDNLNKMYSPAEVPLLPFNLNLAAYRRNEYIMLELRRRFKINPENADDKNKIFAKKLIAASLSPHPIMAQVTIKYKDAFKQKLKLKELDLL